MRERERRRVQEEAVLNEALLATMSVTGIVDNRVADGRQVHTNLVRTSGIEL